MRILIALLILCSMNAFGQSRMDRYFIDTNKPNATRIDTIYGAIVTLDGLDVIALAGFRVDSVEVWEVQIKCPDGNMGCPVLHYGDLDFTKASTYHALKKGGSQMILEKHIIKFIE